MERQIIPDLKSYEYEHPFDRQALDRLKGTRGLDLVTQKVLDYGLEKYLLIKHTGDNIRIKAEKLPEVHKILEEACGILEMTEVPELYITLEDKIKSFTSGEHRRIIVLSSGAIEYLSDDELLFIIGRELGHIRSNHVVYRMMADSLKTITQFVGDISLGIGKPDHYAPSDCPDALVQNVGVHRRPCRAAYLSEPRRWLQMHLLRLPAYQRSTMAGFP